MSEFHRLLLGIHAQSRRIDRDQALLGALGVGAFAYPHQLDSVHRMVTGVACRWLLADEVGLGKTIQAIMVMRALAAQSPRTFNCALVVPDDLASQWAEELITRGHVVPIEAGEPGDATGNLVLRMVRASRLLAGKIAAEKLDLLIVDEFTRLQVQVRRDLIAAARVIPNILVLTATPALHLSSSRGELMSLLEPEADRIAHAEGRDILEVLAERETRAIERHEVRQTDVVRRRAMAESYGLYRRLIRTVRADYPDALPKRVYQPIRLAPTDGDIARPSATRSYLDAAFRNNVELRHDLLLQVAGRSRASLTERISTLRRSPAEVQAAWQSIDRCLRDEPGDAKLDALIDHVRSVQARNPDTRIVVVADDNPTTDYVRDALEKLADVQVAKKRRTVGAAADLEVQVAMLNEALDDFISGEAKVLVAADAAREGHNLQFADEIIFFALPWSPLDIQQWIGRIDRLGTKGRPSNRRITITPIVTEGSIENQILSVLEGTGVFLKSEVFDEDEWAGITAAIAEAAEGHTGVGWNDAAREARELGEVSDAWLNETRLPPAARTSIAARLETRLRTRAYASPMAEVENYPWDWFFMRERASELFMRLACEDYLDVRNGQMEDQRFKTVWYRSRPRPGDTLLADLDPKSSYHRQAYITRRAAIECPPTTHIKQDDDTPRRLHFFDHGCSLHDDLIRDFERLAPKPDSRAEFVVGYPTGHPALRWAGRRLLVLTAELDPSSRMTFDMDSLFGAESAELSKPERDARNSMIRLALSQFEADRRWLKDLAPPEVLVAVVEENEGAPRIASEAAPALFDPLYDRKYARQIGKLRTDLSDARHASATEAGEAQLKKLGSECLSRAVVAVRSALTGRLFGSEAEAENLIAAVQAEIKAADRLDTKFEFNRALKRGSDLALRLAQAVWVGRENRLKGLEAAVASGSYLEKNRIFWVVPRPVSDVDR